MISRSKMERKFELQICSKEQAKDVMARLRACGYKKCRAYGGIDDVRFIRVEPCRRQFQLLFTEIDESYAISMEEFKSLDLESFPVEHTRNTYLPTPGWLKEHERLKNSGLLYDPVGHRET